MQATIQKWGNSQGLRIPKALLKALDLAENSKVELTQVEDSIIISKVQEKKHKSLEERITDFYGKGSKDIGLVVSEPEYDWGESQGDEEW